MSAAPWLRLVAGLLCALLAAWQPARAADAAPSAAQQQLHALFDERWEALMQAYPEWATSVGDHRHGDRLSDASPEAIAANFAATQRTLEQALAIDRAALPPVDQASLDIFVHELQDDLRFKPFVGYRSMSLGSQFGFHGSFAGLLMEVPVDTAAQVRQVLARMAAYPKRVDQELSLLREGLALGWVPPRTVLERVLAAIDRQIDAPLDKSPYFEPFARLGSGIPPAEQQALREQGRRAIETQVLPAMRKLRAFVAGEYLAGAPQSGALAGYPGGAEVYAAVVQSQTTMQLTAAEIHAIGLRETARLRGEMEGVMLEMKFEGSFAQFVTHLNTDPKYFHASPDALLAGYREIAKRIDPELPRLFAVLPRAPYGVRAMPDHFDADRAATYDDPSLDGTRPGWFNANTKAWRKQPTWSMESLVAHEAVPGHHLQAARAVELGELPRFRRSAFFTAYVEGWALYAETLGPELGLYKDPTSRFGHLQWQAFRAARLVVDTGIHAQAWSRQQAIDYMVERTGMDAAMLTAEVDRYTSWPGQALAYMIGQLEIIALRDRARAQLGDRFDIRQFHMVVLDQGSVPLPALRRAVDAWIAKTAAAARP
jgi:uncharacterized protein (DUF885 family)